MDRKWNLLSDEDLHDIINKTLSFDCQRLILKIWIILCQLGTIKKGKKICHFFLTV